MIFELSATQSFNLTAPAIRVLVQLRDVTDVGMTFKDLVGRAAISGEVLEWLRRQGLIQGFRVARGEPVVRVDNFTMPADTLERTRVRLTTAGWDVITAAPFRLLLAVAQGGSRHRFDLAYMLNVVGGVDLSEAYRFVRSGLLSVKLGNTPIDENYARKVLKFKHGASDAERARLTEAERREYSRPLDLWVTPKGRASVYV